jgi:hypothetical protein
MERHIQMRAAHLSLQSKKGPGSASGPLKLHPEGERKKQTGELRKAFKKAEDQPGNFGIEAHTKTQVTQVERD